MKWNCYGVQWFIESIPSFILPPSASSDHWHCWFRFRSLNTRKKRLLVFILSLLLLLVVVPSMEFGILLFMLLLPGVFSIQSTSQSVVGYFFSLDCQFVIHSGILEISRKMSVFRKYQQKQQQNHKRVFHLMHTEFFGEQCNNSYCGRYLLFVCTYTRTHMCT